MSQLEHVRPYRRLAGLTLVLLHIDRPAVVKKPQIRRRRSARPRQHNRHRPNGRGIKTEGGYAKRRRMLFACVGSLPASLAGSQGYRRYDDDPDRVRDRIRGTAADPHGSAVENASLVFGRSNDARRNRRLPVHPDRGISGWLRQYLRPRTAPVGRLSLATEAIVCDTDERDAVVPSAHECAIPDLPADALTFLNGSRYCETDILCETARSLFGGTPPGRPRIQEICDFVHTTSTSATNTRTQQGRPSARSRSAEGCAATLPIWRSPCAAT